jgi:hypothetical protein
VRQRSISAIGVVLVGVLPLLIGGPAWTLLLIALGLIGLSEYYGFTRALGVRPLRTGFVVLPVALGAAVLDLGEAGLLGTLGLALLLPFLIPIFSGGPAGSAITWAMEAAGVE